MSKSTKATKSTKSNKAKAKALVKKAVKSVLLVTFEPGEKAPKLGNDNLNNTKRSWDFLVDYIDENGAQSVGTMQILLQEKFNHGSFVRYAIKNKWLVAA